MATAEPLTPPWLRDYRDRVDPQLTPVQRLAFEVIWSWFDELWEGEQADSARLRDLCDEVLPLLEQIETSTGLDRDGAITELAARLRSIDLSVFIPR